MFVIGSVLIKFTKTNYTINLGLLPHSLKFKNDEHDLTKSTHILQEYSPIEMATSLIGHNVASYPQINPLLLSPSGHARCWHFTTDCRSAGVLVAGTELRHAHEQTSIPTFYLTSRRK